MKDIRYPINDMRFSKWNHRMFENEDFGSVGTRYRQKRTSGKLIKNPVRGEMNEKRETKGENLADAK